MPFWKRQNCTDSKKIGGCPEFKEEDTSDVQVAHRGLSEQGNY